MLWQLMTRTEGISGRVIRMLSQIHYTTKMKRDGDKLTNTSRLNDGESEQCYKYIYIYIYIMHNTNKAIYNNKKLHHMT